MDLFCRFRPPGPDRPIGCLSKPRCWIQALTPVSGALAGPQPIAPPRPLSSEDVIFLFLSPALPPPSPSLSSFSFLIPLSSPPPLLFSHRYVPLALKGIGFPLRTTPPPLISVSFDGAWFSPLPVCRPTQNAPGCCLKKYKYIYIYIFLVFLPPPSSDQLEWISRFTAEDKRNDFPLTET